MKLTVGQRKVWAGFCAGGKAVAGIAAITAGMIAVAVGFELSGISQWFADLGYFYWTCVPSPTALFWFDIFSDIYVVLLWGSVGYQIWRWVFPSCRRCVDDLATKRGWVEEPKP